MILTWLVTLTTAIWFVFLVWYTIRARWWKIALGRNVFGVSLILFLLLLRSTLSHWAPDSQEHHIAAFIVYGLAAGLGLERIIHMEKAQRKKDK